MHPALARFMTLYKSRLGELADDRLNYLLQTPASYPAVIRQAARVCIAHRTVRPDGSHEYPGDLSVLVAAEDFDDSPDAWDAEAACYLAEGVAARVASRTGDPAPALSITLTRRNDTTPGFAVSRPRFGAPRKARHGSASPDGNAAGVTPPTPPQPAVSHAEIFTPVSAAALAEELDAAWDVLGDVGSYSELASRTGVSAAALLNSHHIATVAQYNPVELPTLEAAVETARTAILALDAHT